MNRGHIPYGYQIQKGKAVIDQQEVKKLRTIYQSYLSGLSLVKSANAVGLTLTHSSVKNMLRNPCYLGDEFYPQIVDQETFQAFEEERQRREERWHEKRTKKQQTDNDVTVNTMKTLALTRFRMREVERTFQDPYQQAEYFFSLIDELDDSPDNTGKEVESEE